MAYRSVFTYPGFRTVWLATGISALGHRLFEIAFIWLVFEFTTDPTMLGMALAIVALPEIASTLLAGIAADRYNRIHVLAASELSRAALTPLIPLFAADDLTTILAVGALIGIAGSFGGPARGAVVPNLVPDDELDEGNSTIQLLIVSSRLLYVVSGALVLTIGATTVILISAIPPIFSAFVLLWAPDHLSVPELSDGTEGGSLRRTLTDVTESITLFRENGILQSLLVLQTAHLFVVAPIGSVVLPVFTVTEFAGNSLDYGVLYGAYFAGMFFSAGFFSNVMDREIIHGELVVWGTAISGLFIAGMALAPRILPLPFVGAAVFHGLAGAATFFSIVAIQTLIQLVPSDTDRGKVYSVLAMIGVVVSPVSFLVAGPLVSTFGPSPVLFGIGILAGLAGLSMMLTPLYDADVDEDAIFADDAGESPVLSL